MTTPSDPQSPGENPVPVPPEPTPEEAAAAKAAADAAAAQAAQTEAIRALASEIAKQTMLDFDPATLRKGTVSSIESTGTPPTVTVTLSGSTTTIPGVRYLDSYAPVVNDVVIFLKQTSDVLIIGQIAGQFAESVFTDVPLDNGNGHNGNGEGNFQIRRVWDHGAWRVDLRGGINYVANNIVDDLDPKYRPTGATRRTLLCARNAAGTTSVKVDFNADGTVSMVKASAAGNSDTHNHGSHDHSIPDSSHTHGSHEHVIPNTDHFHSGTTTVVSGHEHGIPNTSHSHSGTTNVTTPNTSTHNHGGTNGTTPNDDTHSHAIDDPLWISFNGLHYYL